MEVMDEMDWLAAFAYYTIDGESPSSSRNYVPLVAPVTIKGVTKK